MLGWGCLLAIIGVNWLRYLIETHRYLPIPIAPTPFDWLALVLVLPLAQEVLFRGAILSALQRSWHPAWAVLLTAACSVVLLPLQSWLAFVFLCSIGYALVFRGAGTVLAPTAAHALVALTLLLARMHPQFLLRVPADDWIKFALVSLGGIILGSIPGRRSG